jgi:hypothetical protein
MKAKPVLAARSTRDALSRIGRARSAGRARPASPAPANGTPPSG